MKKLLLVLTLLAAILLPAIPASALVCDATFPLPDGTDQTTALQTVIDDAPDGVLGDRTKLCFPTGGPFSYTVEGQLRVEGQAHLHIYGRDASLNRTALVGDTDPTAKTNYVPQLAIVSSSDIRVGTLNINSVGTCSFDHDYEGEAAVKVQGSVDVTLNGLDIFGPAGDGYTFAWKQAPGSQAAGVPNERVNVNGGTVTCAGRQGVAISSNIFDSGIHGVTFVDVARSTLDMEMAGVDAFLELDGFTFEDNVAMDVHLNFIAGGGGGIQRNVSILNNTTDTLKGKYGDADMIVDRFDVVYSGNTGTEALTHGSDLLLSFKGVDGLTVIGNSQPVTSPAHATSYSICSGVVEAANSWNPA